MFYAVLKFFGKIALLSHHIWKCRKKALENVTKKKGFRCKIWWGIRIFSQIFPIQCQFAGKFKFMSRIGATLSENGQKVSRWKNWDVSFKGYQNYYTLVKFPAEFKFLVRFSFGHVTKREINKITNKSKLKKVKNSLKSALLSYNKNYPREIFFYNIYALLEKFQKKKFFLARIFLDIFA